MVASFGVPRSLCPPTPSPLFALNQLSQNVASTCWCGTPWFGYRNRFGSQCDFLVQLPRMAPTIAFAICCGWLTASLTPCCLLLTCAFLSCGQNICLLFHALASMPPVLICTCSRAGSSSRLHTDTSFWLLPSPSLESTTRAKLS